MKKLLLMTTAWLSTALVSCGSTNPEGLQVKNTEAAIEVIPPAAEVETLYSPRELEIRREPTSAISPADDLTGPSVVMAVDNRPHLKMTKTSRLNSIGNPIYLVEMYKDGVNISSVAAVSGRAWTQTLDRHTAGNESPLPNGRYIVARSPIAGVHVEVGSLFLPIQPQFRTGRSALGFHVDPSFSKNNGEDGTAGCIGLTSIAERNLLFDFVKRYKPAYLEVNI